MCSVPGPTGFFRQSRSMARSSAWRVFAGFGRIASESWASVSGTPANTLVSLREADHNRYF
jgi:hypothetical protein